MKKLFVKKYFAALVLAAAVLVAAFIILTSPETKKHKPEKAVPAVSTVPLQKGDYAINVEAFGRVIPAREVAITPEVTGKIVELGKGIQPGGILKKGDLIIQIEKADYELQIERAEASLRQAEAALELEKGRQKVAKREWEIFGKDVDPSLASGELALRKPQLAEAEANVKSANAQVQEAKLNLQRTTITAPFDSIVLNEDAEVGQRVGPEMTVAHIVGTDSFWINSSVPFDSYQLIIPEDGDKGSPVTVYLDTGLNGDIPRCGNVVRKLGDLDPDGRMGRVLISIEDPLSLHDGGRSVIPLESYVRTEISAGELKNVYKIPRQGLRENNSVWVAGPDNKLAVKEVKIVWRYKDYIYITDGFSEGDRLITSHLANVIPGMEVLVRDNGEDEKQIATMDIDRVCE